MITCDMARRNNLPKYEYLYRRIRHDVRAGLLAADERLPSKRALADHLSVSVSTVEQAYNVLVGEGYVIARPGSGFYVARHRATGVYDFTTPTAPAIASAPADGDARDASALAENQADARQAAPVRDTFDLKANRSSMDLFPAETWARIMRRKLSERDSALFETVPFNGLAELRRAIATQLYEFRGMLVSPDRIVIGAGTEYLYGRLLQLFGASTIMAIGDPGYKKLADISNTAGVLWSHVPLDDEGIRIDLLDSSRAEVVHVSPANLFPMGVAMSDARCEQLLAWLSADSRRYLIEDDYDSEFSFGTRLRPPLFTQDDSDSIIYLNTFSKTLVPSIRISYMVLPNTLMSLYRSQLSFFSCTVSSFEQLALAEFMSGGYFERHINRLKRHFRRQRSAAMEAIGSSPLMRIAQVHPAEVGTHLLLDVRTGLSDDQVRQAAQNRGMSLAMLSDYCARPSARHAHRVVINYASIDASRMTCAIDLLADVFRRDIDRTT